MKNNTKLLAGAAIGALVIGLCGPAQAATAKHHRKPAAAAANAAQAAEIKELREEVQALSARLNAQEAGQQQVKTQAAQAEAVALQTKEAQAGVDDQIQSIPAQVNLAVAAMPKPKKLWAENTSISGRMYYDLTNINQESNSAKVPATGSGFDIKRFYLGVDHKFNDTYSANLTTDFQYASAISATELYLKKAYLQAKYSDALTIRVGATDMPWIPFAEDVYGYRFVEQTLTDRTKFGTSSDWGVHAIGSFNKGMVSYQLSVVDGAGYKAPLRSKGMDVEGRISAKIDNITLAVGGYTGKLGKDTQGAVTFHTATRFNALAAYTTKQFRVGAEYFSAQNWTSVTSAAKDSSDGYSVFGSYNFTDQISAFGRYDWVKPNKDTAPSKKDGYFNIGLNYEPTKIVDFALVYKRDQVDHGTLSTGNGTIGGSNKGTYDEVGLFGQFRF
jgi:hypothetical protein